MRYDLPFVRVTPLGCVHPFESNLRRPSPFASGPPKPAKPHGRMTWSGTAHDVVCSGDGFFPKHLVVVVKEDINSIHYDKIDETLSALA